MANSSRINWMSWEDKKIGEGLGSGILHVLTRRSSQSKGGDLFRTPPLLRAPTSIGPWFDLLMRIEVLARASHL
jgi:hypothetical protein